MLPQYTIRLNDITIAAPQVQTFHCAKPVGFTHLAGQYFFVTVQIQGQIIKKPLSISSAPYESELAFTKKISNSLFSQALLALRPGDTVLIEGPVGNFTLPAQPAKLAFLAGGIGITPFRSMLLEEAHTRQGHDIILLFGNEKMTDIIFKNAFDALSVLNLHIHYTLTGAEPCSIWTGLTGMICPPMILQTMPNYKERLFYICGSPAMVTAITNILKIDMGIPAEQIKVERLVGY
jgi:ferredoxin-NADP reductase